MNPENWNNPIVDLIYPTERPSVDEFRKANIHVVILNWNLSEDTWSCVEHLQRNESINFYVHLLDNGSEKHHLDYLKDKVSKQSNNSNICLYSSSLNSGFAVGNNKILNDLILELNEDQLVLLLNNDAFVKEDFLKELVSQVNFDKNVEMIASRMMSFHEPNEIDNLGNTFYCSGITSNRVSEKALLFCPCAGAGLYSVRLLKDLKEVHGEIFDEDFFCYVEDSDLGFRALGLGYKCGYADKAISYHKGSASSGGKFSSFVMYFGLRNSVFFLIKSIPLKILILNSPYILFMQLMIPLRYLSIGKLGIILKIYWHIFLKLNYFIKKRKSVVSTYRNIHLKKNISKQFYDSNYIYGVLKKMWWCPGFIANIFFKKQECDL